MNKKIQATKIIITRAEGPKALCGNLKVFEGNDCWENANRWLYSQSHTFPEKGGYDKHDFEIVFENGRTWDGRLDCKSFLCENNDLNIARHVKSFAEFYAGMRKPSHMEDEVYLNFISQHENMKIN